MESNNVEVTSTINNGTEEIVRSINGVEIEKDSEYLDGSYKRSSRIEIEGTNMTTFREMTHDATSKLFITREILPIVDDNNQYIGSHMLKEESDLVNAIEKVEVIETFTIDSKKYTFKTSSFIIGDEKSSEITLDINNKANNSNEKLTISIDKNDNIIYKYMDNSTIKEKFIKNKRGTTLDFFDEKGQPLETYNYDQNGNAIVKFAGHEKLADNFIFEALNNAIPNHYVIAHQIPDALYPKNEVDDNFSK
jgi:hypothetical protein